MRSEKQATMRSGRASSVNISCIVVALLSVSGAVYAGDVRLLEAVKHHDTSAVRTLLAAHVDVNTPGNDGATALHWAAHRDDVDTVDLLLRAAAHVNMADDLGTTPLALAAANGNGRIVEKLLAKGANPNLVSVNGTSPLMMAARAGSASAVKSLLGHGADVNARENSRKQTALMWAAAQRHSEVVRLLLEAGADIHARTLTYPTRVSFGPERPNKDPLAFGFIERGGSTAFLFAARSGDVESAKLLISAGTDVNESLPDNQSAVVVAARSGHEKLAQFLVEQGADPNAAGAGFAPLHIAILHSQPELLKALLNHGADPNVELKRGTPIRRNGGDLELPTGEGAIDQIGAVNFMGATPFWLAAKYADVGLMRILADSGADRRKPLKNGITPLMAAAGFGWNGSKTRRGLDYHVSALGIDGKKTAVQKDREALETLEAVTFLLDKDADVNQTDAEGNTALFGAIELGLESTVKALVDNGAALNVKNKAGQTPLSLTADRGSRTRTTPEELASMRSLLLRLGATE
jgi:uncharacterized protein